MARLSDDCFRDAPPLTVAGAAARIAERLPVLAGIEAAPLAAADGRVLAEDVPAPIPLPPFDNSAVDGYALRHADLAGRLPAGHAPAEGALLAPGAAVRIFTGAPMPPGADTVVMQEDVSTDGADSVRVPPGLAPGANRRTAGEDVARGALALPAGRRLTPRDLALAAALGLPALPVRRRLRVAVLSTGDELREPGEALGPAAIHDANRVTLLALLARRGAETTDLGIVRDRAGALRARLERAAAEHDLVVTSGGVSVGEEDHVRAAIEAAGRLDFWRLAIKPGRPVALGTVAGAPVVGLPGNPAAACLTFLMVVGPLLARLAGETYRAPVGFPVPAAFAHSKRAGPREFVRAVLRPGPDGLPTAHRAPGGPLSGLSASDGFVDLPEDLTRVEPGQTVAFHPHALLG